MERNSATADDVVGTVNVISMCWKRRWLFSLITISIVVVFIAVCLLIPRQYRSSVVLAPNQSSADIKSNLISQFGGLASLAGIDLGGGAVDQNALSMSIIQSTSFLAHFIEKRGLKVAIFANRKWEPTTREWLTDEDVFDQKTMTWTRKESPPKNSEPSVIESVEEFRKFFLVSQDKKTGLISASITLSSPVAAKEWLDQLVSDVNDYIRTNDGIEAEKAISYLNEQVRKTDVAELRQVFFQLIEQKVQTLMLANIRDDYAFKIVDPAFIPEEHYKPKLAAFVVFGLSTGLFISFVVMIFLTVRVKVMAGRSL